MYVALFVILVLFFYSKYIIPDSNLLINIDPIGAVNVFTHSWDSTVGFGLSMNWPASYIFPNLITRLIAFTLFGQRLAQAVFFSLPFLVGTYSMHYLVRVLFDEEIAKEQTKNNILSELTFFSVSLFYVSNIYFILVYVGATSMTYTHIMLPLQIALLIRILSEKKLLYVRYFQFAFATLVMSGTSPPYVLITLILLLCITFLKWVNAAQKVASSITRAIILRRIFILFITTLVINAIWVLQIFEPWSFLKLPENSFPAHLCWLFSCL
jgi:hypothetical protein